MHMFNLARQMFSGIYTALNLLICKNSRTWEPTVRQNSPTFLARSIAQLPPDPKCNYLTLSRPLLRHLLRIRSYHPRQLGLDTIPTILPLPNWGMMGMWR
ncbi:hypothetical protein PILCRDRAFT_663886 [Piloderma croceum F 1598]|uniref:Uncharacterized protein n=1 Tax=Piloderma croceum (strain F 1598) TaxID=765440 RepID=A0A0C3F7E8_PILCF|nr:hypothetical protein PILCRDRAFT_663886 [Piloderma croceum F 1598]